MAPALNVPMLSTCPILPVWAAATRIARSVLSIRVQPARTITTSKPCLRSARHAAIYTARPAHRMVTAPNVPRVTTQSKTAKTYQFVLNVPRIVYPAQLQDVSHAIMAISWSILTTKINVKAVRSTCVSPAMLREIVSPASMAAIS